MVKFNSKTIFCVFLFSLLFFLNSCKTDNRYLDRLNDTALFNEAMQQLTDIVVYDIFSPPVASRVYVYPTIAAYSIIQKTHPNKYMSLEGQLTDYIDVSDYSDPNIIPNLAALHAFLVVGKELIFSENKIDAYRENLYKELREEGLSTRELNTTIEYG